MVTLQVWVKVNDRSSLEAARRLGVASAFLTTNPRLFGRPGDLIYLRAEEMPGSRPRDRFGLVTSDPAAADRARAAGYRVAIRSGVDGFDWGLDLPGEGRMAWARDLAQVEAASARGLIGVVVDPALAAELAALLSAPGSIGELLDRAAVEQGWRSALVDHVSGVSLDFSSLRRRSRLAGKAILAAGLQPGDTAAVSGRNLIEWVEVFFGAAYAGITLVHVNPSLRGNELYHVLEKSGARLLLVEPGGGRESAVAEARVKGLPNLDAVVELTGGGYRRFLAEGSLLPEGALPGADPGAIAAIQFTSGTTGLPKGAMLTHRGMTANASASAARLGLGPHDRLCLPLPLFHCFGSVVGVLAAVSAGAAVVLPAPWFQPEDTLDSIRKQRATVLYGVPTMFVALLETVEPRTRPRTLRCGLVGGAPVGPELMSRIASELSVAGIGQVYGLTEASPVITMTSPDDPETTRFGTVGRPLAGVEVRIVDASGRLMAPGEPGELETRSTMLMAGYLDDPAATAETVVGGWLRTGDLATADREGRVRIVGRAKDMIIRGGENVYPAEVEAVLASHPSVRHAAVVGIPSPTLGEEVVAYVEPATSVSADDLLDHCRRHLAPFKVPREIHVVAELEKTASGKVIKAGLVDRPPTTARRSASPTGPDLELPLVELPPAASDPIRPVVVVPQTQPMMRRSTGWTRAPVGKGWRPKVRVLAPLAVGETHQRADGPREGWVRPKKATWV